MQSCRHPKTLSKATSSFSVRPRGNRFPRASTPTRWYFVHFRKSKCVCAALLVTKIIRGTAPERGSSKAPRQVKAARGQRSSKSRKRHTAVNDRGAYSGRPPSHNIVLGHNPHRPSTPVRRRPPTNADPDQNRAAHGNSPRRAQAWGRVETHSSNDDAATASCRTARPRARSRMSSAQRPNDRAACEALPMAWPS
jgi:hypothetical protein